MKTEPVRNIALDREPAVAPAVALEHLRRSSRGDLESDRAGAEHHLPIGRVRLSQGITTLVIAPKAGAFLTNVMRFTRTPPGEAEIVSIRVGVLELLQTGETRISADAADRLEKRLAEAGLDAALVGEFDLRTPDRSGILLTSLCPLVLRVRAHEESGHDFVSTLIGVWVG